MNVSHHDFEHLDLPQHPAALQIFAHGLVDGQCEAQSYPAATHKAFNAGSIHHVALAVCVILFFVAISGHLYYQGSMSGGSRQQHLFLEAGYQNPLTYS